MRFKGSRIIHNLVVLIDFIIVNTVISIYYYEDFKRGSSVFAGISLPQLLLYANAAMAIAQMCFSNVMSGHYRAIDKVLRQVGLLSVVFGTSLICLLLTGRYFFHTQVPQLEFMLWSIGYTVMALVLASMVEYLTVKYLRRLGRNSRMLLFVGDSKLIAKAYVDMNMQAHAGLCVLGYFSDTPIADPMVGMLHLGTLEQLKKRIERDDRRYVDDIYCTDIPGNPEMVSRMVDYAMRKGIQFNYVPPFLTEFGYCLKPRVEGELVVFSNLNEPLQSMSNRFMKRAFDIVVSSVAIVCIVPLIPIIGAIIKISSPGPIFFKQKRTGLNGEEFNMLKFRSMHVNKDADRVQATKDDPRKFRFGDFMRKTSIDELPQFFNVFVGDMSIVGPRPHMVAHTDEYRKKIYEYMLRHLVRPGITGWAQVTGFRGETPELWQMEGRVQRDLWYIQNWTFLLDIRIVWRTLILALKRDEKAF